VKKYFRVKKKLKGYHEVNLLMRWGVFFSIAFSFVVAYLLQNISFNLMHSRNIFDEANLFKRFLYIVDIDYDLDTKLLVVILSVVIIYFISQFFANHVNRKYLNRFNRLKEIGTYIESSEKIHFSKKKYDHVVLILHGFSGAPQEFEYLIEQFKKNNIDYYVPNLLGFGLDNLSLLNHIKRRDWYRISLNQYDYLSSVSNKVSVVGQSMGALLASYIASNRAVHNLILIAPAFYPSKSNLKFKKILTTRVISSLYLTIMPFSPKPINKGYGYLGSTLDPEVAKKVFHYLTIPVKSIREVFFMQNEARIDKLSFESLHLLYGKYEKTIDIEKVRRAFHEMEFSFSECCFLNSGHNVLLDYDRGLSCQYIVDILN
jgi:esterase/lipase